MTDQTPSPSLRHYGTCPHCGAWVVNRERRLDGNDTCENGHVFPSKATIPLPPPPKP
jgi:hypothetical protein